MGLELRATDRKSGIEGIETRTNVSSALVFSLWKILNITRLILWILMSFSAGRDSLVSTFSHGTTYLVYFKSCHGDHFFSLSCRLKAFFADCHDMFVVFTSASADWNDLHYDSKLLQKTVNMFLYLENCDSIPSFKNIPPKHIFT